MMAIFRWNYLYGYWSFLRKNSARQRHLDPDAGGDAYRDCPEL
jgi:hypothetical protein